MKARVASVSILLLTLCALGPAQGTGLTTPCDGFNHAIDASDGQYQLPGWPFAQQTNEIAILYVPRRTIVIRSVDLFFGIRQQGFGQFPSGRIQIRGTDPLTGRPGPVISGTPVACGSPLVGVTPSVPVGTEIGWRGVTFCQPVTLTANEAYWVTFYDGWGQAQNLGTYSRGRSTPYVTSYGGPAGTLAPWSSVLNDQRFKVRLRGTTCSLGATSITVGQGSGSMPPPGLAPSLPPVLGTSGFALTIDSAPAGLPAAIFWTPGYSLAGTAIAPGALLHLDVPSLASSIVAGANPLLTGQTVAGTAFFNLPLPNDPSLAGLVLAVQGVVVDPAGIPTQTPGVSFTLTNAVVLVIGD